MKLFNLLPTCFLLFISAGIFAQENIPEPKVQTYLLKAAEAQYNNDQEDVLRQIDKISKNDSLYTVLLVTKSRSLIELERYDDALDVCNEGLSRNHNEYKIVFYINKGVCYLNSKQYNDAVKTYDEALKLAPVNYLLHYNRGVALKELEKYQEAVESYKMAIRCNPTYPASHLNLGLLCVQRNLLTQAMMCFNTYLILNQDGEKSFDVLSVYDKFMHQKYDGDLIEATISKDDESFEEIDLIIGNFASLNKNFKIPNKLSLAVIKQNYAMMQQLKDYEGNSGFWDQYYVPLHKYIIDNDLFNDYTYSICSSVENPKYKKIVDKKLSAIRSFVQSYQTEVQVTFGSGEKKNDLLPYSLYEEEVLLAAGYLDGENPEGSWEFYGKNGVMSAQGDFKSGKKVGEWKRYDTNGNIKEINKYKDDELDGETLVYYENGALKLSVEVENGNRNGATKEYTKSGAMSDFSTYEDGELAGVSRSFHSVGEESKNYEVEYVKGKINGTIKRYFSDGKIWEELGYKDDLRQGLWKYYFYSGNLSVEREYLDGVETGSYKSYYDNGELQETGVYEDGKQQGIWTSFFDDGTLYRESTFSNGVETKNKIYRRTGEILNEYDYTRGNIIGYRYFDIEGNIFHENKKKGGEFFHEGYFENGKKSSEGLYDVDGGKVGNWKFFDYDGWMSSMEFRDDKGKLSKIERYYPNGKLKSIEPYKNDSLSGYYKSYYPNGSISEHGWYVSDNREGEWKEYYIDGTLNRNDYYNRGKLFGTSNIKSVDGKPLLDYLFFNGNLEEERHFDHNGINYLTIDLEYEKTDTSIWSTFPNEQKKNVYHIKNGIKHGVHMSYYFNGSIWTKGNYHNGLENGSWKWYHDNGQLYKEGSYVLGEPHGKWKTFHENGKLEDDREYDYGVLIGSRKEYNENGTLIREKTYLSGELHGNYVFYSEDGKLQLVRVYDYGRLIGWTCENPDGKLKEVTPIKNGTAKIEATFRNGKKSRSFEMVNGTFEGKYEEYYSTGQLHDTQTYINGEKEGEYKAYHINGKLKKQQSYLMGTSHGKTKIYHENGQLMEEVEYLNGEQVGDSKKYDNSGKLILVRTYFDGEVVEEKTL
ncbi:MAG: antitoxin component YwqK of YwqJK toxin-antitoxin module [Crocinitomicaceae bacterium]|jgi:antitoxin component YwqK of YwqJK toxin-antitoxin module